MMLDHEPLEKLISCVYIALSALIVINQIVRAKFNVCMTNKEPITFTLTYSILL